MAAEPRRSDAWIWVVILLLVLVLVPGMVLWGASGTGMVGGAGSWMGGWGLLGMGMVIVVVVVLVAILLAVPHGVEPMAPPPYPYAPYPVPPAPPIGPAAAIQILDARYARGEISREDYLRMRQDLESRKV